MNLGRRMRELFAGAWAMAAAIALADISRADAAADGGDADAGPAGSAAAAHPGPAMEFSEAPAGAERWASACSFRHPFCVRPAPGTPAKFSAAALLAGERAWETITGALAATPPDGDLEGRWQVYLVESALAGGGARTMSSAREPRSLYDRASSFALVDRRTPPGCALDLALARAVARGSLWRAAPGTDPGSAEAATEALAQLATPCSVAQERDDALEFQSAPERAVVDPRSGSFDRGAAMFFDWLDHRFGTRPGGVLLGLWAVAPTKTPAGAWRWAGAPTEVDVLGASLASALWKDSTIDDVFAAFAAARASVEPAPRLTWRIPWPLEERHLSSGEPVSPTGSSYVAMDRAGAPRGATLRVEARWEDYERMRWIVLKLDGAGKVLDELRIPSTDRATGAAMTVENLDAVDHLVVIGVNLRSTEMPFDPDDGIWEPHGWVLSLASQGPR
jgi:hypothetical protein